MPSLEELGYYLDDAKQLWRDHDAEIVGALIVGFIAVMFLIGFLKKDPKPTDGPLSYEEELEIGKHVDLLFRLPGAGIWLRAQGEVAGCEVQDGWVAVRGKFTGIDVGDAAILTQWLRSLANLRRVA